MLKFTKQIILFFMLIISSLLNSEQINSYQKLAESMENGCQFTIVLNLTEATGNPNMPTGYFIPKAMMQVPANEQNLEHIATSDLHFSNYTGRPGYEYVKYQFFTDGSAQILMNVYDPVTFETIGSPHKIHCSFGKGLKIFTH